MFQEYFMSKYFNNVIKQPKKRFGRMKKLKFNKKYNKKQIRHFFSWVERRITYRTSTKLNESGCLCICNTRNNNKKKYTST